MRISDDKAPDFMERYSDRHDGWYKSIVSNDLVGVGCHARVKRQEQAVCVVMASPMPANSGR